MRDLKKQLRRYLEIEKRMQSFPAGCSDVVKDLRELRQELTEDLHDAPDAETALVISLLIDRAQRDHDNTAFRAGALLTYLNNSSKHP